MRDPYKLLGVPRTASPEDIKKAYRRLVKELHPDLNPGDKIVEQRFKEICTAYEVLGDPEKRARFDRGEIDADGRARPDSNFQRAYAEAAGSPWGTRRRRGPFGMGAGGADSFEDLFARGGFRTKGADVSYTMQVDFLDAMRGARRRLTLSDGRSIDVAIPPGTADGDKLRLKGQGLGGMGGGLDGDAIVEVHVDPHPFFTRNGQDIQIEVPATLHEAVLGATIEVPTIDGRVMVKVPPGSNAGTVLRLRGKGVADRRTGRRGDQLVKLRLALPDQPDEELRSFLSRWRPKAEYQPRKKAGLD